MLAVFMLIVLSSLGPMLPAKMAEAEKHDVEFLKNGLKIMECGRYYRVEKIACWVFDPISQKSLGESLLSHKTVKIS